MMLGRAKVNLNIYNTMFDQGGDIVVCFCTCRFVDGKYGRKRS